MSSPLVSVVIPTHNRADLLAGAVESVLRQHGEQVEAPDAIEVIVVDDASTDQTPKVLARYERAVVAIRNETNRERGASRNTGAAAARGRWLAFLDSDDEWEDGKLAAQLRAVGSAKACVTGCWLSDERGALLGIDDRADGASNADIDLINPYRAVPSSLLIDRELFLGLGGFPEDRDVQGSEDWLLMAKLVRSGCEPVRMRELLVRYRVHARNSTASPAAYLRSTLAAVDWLERNGLATSERAALARAQKYEVAARTYALRGDAAAAVRCMRSAASLVPASRRLALIRANGARSLRRCAA
jgi:glycosyltransferase involved in cell wall biosynthesis